MLVKLAQVGLTSHAKLYQARWRAIRVSMSSWRSYQCVPYTFHVWRVQGVTTCQSKSSNSCSQEAKEESFWHEKCNKNNCRACPFVKETKEIEGPNFKWKISKKVDCDTENVVYMISCSKSGCNMTYIGETEQFKKRLFGPHWINSKSTFEPSNWPTLQQCRSQFR